MTSPATRKLMIDRTDARSQPSWRTITIATRSSAERSQALSSWFSTPGQSAGSSPGEFLSRSTGLGTAGLEAQNGASNGVRALTAGHHSLVGNWPLWEQDRSRLS